jgi:hypothetical protein
MVDRMIADFTINFAGLVMLTSGKLPIGKAPDKV